MFRALVLLMFPVAALAQPIPLKVKMFPGAQALPVMAAASKLLAERLKVSPEVAARTWELMTDPKFGIASDARFDMQGFRNVLALRAEIEGSWLSFYENAMKRIAR